MESDENLSDCIGAIVKKEVPDEDSNEYDSFQDQEKGIPQSERKEETDEQEDLSVKCPATEAGNDKENEGKRRIRLDTSHFASVRSKDNEGRKIFVLQQANRSNREGPPTFLCIDGRIEGIGGLKRKIPRPANAFMLFANEWRKKLAAENPRESNKDISVRLGLLWKNMTKEVKEKYFAMAREVDAEHKRKYPDYVYNPKEARLRKAMREQSRELTRRSILQNAIGRAAGGGVTSSTASTAGGFLEHQHPFGCAPSPVPSSLPMQNAERLAAEPWFPTKATLHSPRLDWYGQPAADPIERLQAMGTMHQRAVLDKRKDAMRSQHASPECAAAFSGPPYSEFNGRDVRRQEPLQDYAEFPDGQKWHPYQNGASSHQHPRTPHPSQMGGILHPSIQNTSSHGHGHGAWGQFCHGVLPHVSGMARNVGIRGPRHAVFLRDHPSNRHCAFPEDVSRLPYTATKLDVDTVRTYPSTEHQMPRLIETPAAPVAESSTKIRRDEEEDSRWESSSVPNNMSLEGLVPTSTPQQQDSSASREKAQATRRAAERFEAKKKSASKQPLPGFHQAFGSTEIGKFSRSEYFVSMVGESSAVEADNSDIIPNYLPIPAGLFPFPSTSRGILGSATPIHRVFEGAGIVPRVFPDGCCWFPTPPSPIVSRNTERSTNLQNRTPFPEYGHHPIRGECYCSSEMHTFLHHQRYNCSMMLDEARRRYAIIKMKNERCRTETENSTNYEFEARRTALEEPSQQESAEKAAKVTQFPHE